MLASDYHDVSDALDSASEEDMGYGAWRGQVMMMGLAWVSSKCCEQEELCSNVVVVV